VKDELINQYIKWNTVSPFVLRDCNQLSISSSPCLAKASKIETGTITQPNKTPGKREIVKIDKTIYWLFNKNDDE
jgi:hypothetical protein